MYAAKLQHSLNVWKSKICWKYFSEKKIWAANCFLYKQNRTPFEGTCRSTVINMPQLGKFMARGSGSFLKKKLQVIVKQLEAINFHFFVVAAMFSTTAKKGHTIFWAEWWKPRKNKWFTTKRAQHKRDSLNLLSESKFSKQLGTLLNDCLNRALHFYSAKLCHVKQP